jgi:pyruvate dehydrogenase complex dihydrolipoamide acetyltransferase long form
MARSHLLFRGVKGKPLLFPALSPTMTSGKLIKWLKQEGSKIELGDGLFSVETDKATLDADSTDEGILAKILVPDGTANVPVNKMIAVLVKAGEDWKNVEVPTAAESSSSSADRKSAPSSSDSVGAGGHAEAPHEYVGFPSVRRLLNAYNVNPTQVTGTGPSGRLVKGDVLTYVEKNQLQPAAGGYSVSAPIKASSSSSSSSSAAVPPPPLKVVTASSVTSTSSEYVDKPASTMRQVIAKRLTESKTQVPHLYLTRELKLGKVLALRKQFKEAGANVSVNDIVVKAVAKALRLVPEANVYFNPKTGKSDAQKTVDVSVAVAIPNGLITPIIKNTDQKSFGQINKEMKELAEKARKGALLPQEYQGGTFCVSNLGMFGTNYFTAVINPPQAGILAVGAGIERITYGPKDKLVNETFVKVTMSCDARAVSPFDAARFLDSFAKVMEEPSLVSL